MLICGFVFFCGRIIQTIFLTIKKIFHLREEQEGIMKVAVVGATGLVGTKMLQVLAERNFPVTELIPVASERSVGKEKNDLVYKDVWKACVHR